MIPEAENDCALAKAALRESYMLTLYNLGPSTCSQKARLVLFEKTLDWEDRPIDFQKREHLSGWYLALNPNGVVPTLVHDGAVITDSSVIGEYLDEVYPSPPLQPKDPVARAHMRAWRQFVDEVPTPAIRYPSFNAFVLRLWSDLSDEQFNNYVDSLTLRRKLYRKIKDRNGFSQHDVDVAMDDLRLTLARMDNVLADEEWLAAGDLTLADIALLPTIVRMEDLGLKSMWDHLPRVSGWYDRMQARPSFSQTYYPGTWDLGGSC
jgi:glutathione S-transferase